MACKTLTAIFKVTVTETPKNPLRMFVHLLILSAKALVTNKLKHLGRVHTKRERERERERERTRRARRHTPATKAQ